jgi:hypothetical protein
MYAAGRLSGPNFLAIAVEWFEDALHRPVDVCFRAPKLEQRALGRPALGRLARQYAKMGKDVPHTTTADRERIE